MRKKIALALLTVALLLAGFAGGVYAVADHQPVTGEKLIGVGPLGTAEIPGGTMLRKSLFRFTNPDCVESITITQVSIIKEDWKEGPTVIYEGSFIRVYREAKVREVITEPMEPHEIRCINLWDYMWTGGGDPNDLTDADNWLSVEEALALPLRLYTVEIAWEVEKGATCPLTGWQQLTRQENFTWGKQWTMSESRMVNMKQKA